MAAAVGALARVSCSVRSADWIQELSNCQRSVPAIGVRRPIILLTLPLQLTLAVTECLRPVSLASVMAAAVAALARVSCSVMAADVAAGVAVTASVVNRIVILIAARPRDRVAL